MEVNLRRLICVFAVLHTYIYLFVQQLGTYDHRCMKAWDPVRSPLIKHVTGRLVVGSVTTSEYRLLYVFFACPFAKPSLCGSGLFDVWVIAFAMSVFL